MASERCHLHAVHCERVFIISSSAKTYACTHARVSAHRAQVFIERLSAVRQSSPSEGSNIFGH